MIQKEEIVKDININAKIFLIIMIMILENKEELKIVAKNVMFVYMIESVLNNIHFMLLLQENV